MQQLKLIRGDIVYELSKARDWVIDRVSILTGATKLGAIIITCVIVLYILIFTIGMPIHRKILKKLHIAKQELVKYIDEIIYLLAKYQHASKISKKELGGDPHMAMMTEMFKSGHFEYLDNISLIKENVEKVELLLQKQVVDEEQRTKVHSVQRKMKRLIFGRNLLGRICTVPTCGIYRPFW